MTAPVAPNGDSRPNARELRRLLDAFWGRNGWRRNRDDERLVHAACPSCKSKSLRTLPDGRPATVVDRYPLTIRVGEDERRWALDSSCGCSEEDVLAAVYVPELDHQAPENAVEPPERRVLGAPSRGPREGSTDGDGGPETLDSTALRFASPAELRQSAPPSPPWVWEGYWARGWIALVAGKPKAGKSTVVWAGVEAVVTGAATFFGRRVVGGSVVYVSEESSSTLLPKLPDSDDLRVLTREAAWPKPSWRELVEAATAEAARVGAVLIVFDTLAYWSALPAEREKDAGAVQGVMDPLVGAARAGFAVVFVHHQRKERGEEGDAIRGSTALAGNADVLIEYERPPGEAPHGHRQLVAVGRWPETPPLLVIDYESATGGWRVVGEGDGREDAAPVTWRAALLSALPPEAPGSTLDEIQGLTGQDRRKWSRELKALIEEGAVERAGGGVKGDPHRHWRCSPNAVPEFRPEGGTESGREDSVHAVPLPVGEEADGIESYGKSRPAPDLRDGKHLSEEEQTDRAPPS